ncbi:pro-resilin-like isoform X2 [Macrobrachium nipponense]|uniref:pro-resilin-like isoform X1 n=1 Tax=Macrobrachium nipponense TaxID=159736 RepID=UPI0030C7CCAB
MVAKVIIALVGLVALVAADSFESFERYSRPRFSSGSAESFESGEARYNFDWAVNHGPSRNNFGHQEAGDGENTQGSYFVHPPDGRLQKVAFRASDDDGYIAEVTYSGEAQFPTPSNPTSPVRLPGGSTMAPTSPSKS